jgi:hypothetical protein
MAGLDPAIHRASVRERKWFLLCAQTRAGWMPATRTAMAIVMSARRRRAKWRCAVRSGKDLGAMPLDAFIARIKQEAEGRKDMAD